jgi:hypothetical protein
MRKSEGTHAIGISIGGDGGSGVRNRGSVASDVNWEEHGSKGTGDVGGRKPYGIWCSGRDLDRAACGHMCKSEIAPWLVVRPFEVTVVHRAWAASGVAWVVAELGSKEAREQASGRWSMTDRGSGTSGIQNEISPAKNKASEIELESKWF